MSGGSRQNTTATTNQSALTNSSIRNNPILNESVGVGTDFINRALQFGEEDPLTTGARDVVGDTLSGQNLGEENPFLERVFNRGADAITQRLQGGFSRAGRNIAAARPVAADELGSFRAQLFGDNFQRERDRQVNAVGQAQGLAPIDQFLRRLGQLGNVAGRDVSGSSVSSGTTDQTTRERSSVLDRVLGIGASLFLPGA